MTAGIPEVASSSVTVSASATIGYSYGQTLTVQSSQQQLVQAVVPGNSKMTGTMLVFAGEIDVPYTTELTIVYADKTEVKQGVMPGVFKGVQASKVLVEYNKPIPL